MPSCSVTNAIVFQMTKNDGGVNFIRHLLGISEKFIDDDRLGPLHVSLYYALFQSWNLSKFRNPISVCREELMNASKLGSANTYTTCLKDLDAWGYLKYHPSYNPHKGSQIYMYTFNKTVDNAPDISADKGNSKASEKAAGKPGEKLVIPSKNKLNNKSKSNKINAHEPKRRKNNKKSPVADSGGAGAKSSRVARPTRRQGETHFAKKQWSAVEAQKFFNYYQSNGWMVGGKTPMRSWHAAARNWMLNSTKFSPSQRGIKGEVSKVTKHVSNNKNYAEPL